MYGEILNGDLEHRARAVRCISYINNIKLEGRRSMYLRAMLDDKKQIEMEIEIEIEMGKEGTRKNARKSAARMCCDG